MLKLCPRCNGKKPALLNSPYCLRHTRDFRKLRCWPILNGLAETDLRFIYEHCLVPDRYKWMGRPSCCTVRALAAHLGVRPSALTRKYNLKMDSHVSLSVMAEIIIEMRSS